jgi:hydrogenase maturation protease
MDKFPQQLAQCLEGRICFVGLGNPELGDDAAGIVLLEQLQHRLGQTGGGRFPSSELGFLLAGTQPESHLHHLTHGGWKHVVLLDAADFGAPPGSVALLDRSELRARFPQSSTHRLSLGMLAELIEAGGHTRAWLLAMQPASLRRLAQLSPLLERAIAALADGIVAGRSPETIAA